MRLISQPTSPSFSVLLWSTWTALVSVPSGTVLCVVKLFSSLRGILPLDFPLTQACSSHTWLLTFQSWRVCSCRSSGLTHKVVWTLLLLSHSTCFHLPLESLSKICSLLPTSPACQDPGGFTLLPCLSYCSGLFPLWPSHPGPTSACSRHKGILFQSLFYFHAQNAPAVSQLCDFCLRQAGLVLLQGLTLFVPCQRSDLICSSLLHPAPTTLYAGTLVFQGTCFADLLPGMLFPR